MKRLLLLPLLLAPLIGAGDPIKLRPVELRSVTIPVPDADGKTVATDLRYGDLIRMILLSAPPQGVSADDILRAVEVWEPFKRAIKAGDQRVLLSEADHQYLLGKLASFRWAPRPEFAEPIAEFIAYVRAIKPEEFEAAPKKTTP